MKTLLEVQIEAIEALTEAEEKTEKLIEIICLKFPRNEEELRLLHKALRELVAINILYGRVQVRQETLLKDDTRNTEKEG